MYSGTIDTKLEKLIKRYESYFDEGVGLMGFPDSLTREDLISRINRALSEGKPIDVFQEYYSEEEARKILSGEMLI